jgi:CO/xanthine dehydrogenase FAD-binding subunit
LRKIANVAGDSKASSLSTFEIYSPQDLKEALKFKESEGERAVVMASGTDLLPRMRKRQTSPSVLLSVSSLEDDLKYIRQENKVIHIGALTTLTDLLNSPIFAGRLSVVREAAMNFGAPQIRNVATVGGNICSASSSEDLIPVFLALDAKARLISAAGDRSVPVKDFVKGKRLTALRPSEMLSEIYFDAPGENTWSGYEKLGRRNMLVVAIVNESLLLGLESDLSTVRSARVALNRLAGRVPALAEKTEAFLVGRRLSEETIAGAKRALASELELTSDFRGSAAYRVEVAQAYLGKLIGRCSGEIRKGSLP